MMQPGIDFNSAIIVPLTLTDILEVTYSVSARIGVIISFYTDDCLVYDPSQPCNLYN